MSDESSQNNGSGQGPDKNIEKETTPEVRYVPIEYMPHMQEGEDDEIDLMALAKRIWDGRWTITKVTAVFIFIGLFVALFSPEEFESEAILMPEVQQQQQGGASQLLQRFGGQFGISAGGNTPQGVIPPMIYPRIVNSLSFQLELLEKEIHFRDYGVSTTWPDFLENHYSKPLTGYVKDYTISLPFTVLGGIRSLFREEEEAVIRQDALDEQFIEISQSQFELIENMRDRISVSQDQETGLLNSRVKLQDPRAAAELNRHVIELLKEYVTEYRVEKARQNVEFAEQQKEEAQERFEQSQIQLAEFRDRNISLATARAQTELERLQDEKDLAFNVYSSLSQRLEEARLNLQEQTPIFSEVQAVNVPTRRSEPQRGQLLLIFTLLGGILATGFVLILPFADKVRMNFSN